MIFLMNLPFSYQICYSGSNIQSLYGHDLVSVLRTGTIMEGNVMAGGVNGDVKVMGGNVKIMGGGINGDVKVMGGNVMIMGGGINGNVKVMGGNVNGYGNVMGVNVNISF